MSKVIRGVKQLTVSDVAKELSTKPATVRGKIKAGEMVGRRIGRNFYVPEPAFEKYLRGE